MTGATAPMIGDLGYALRHPVVRTGGIIFMVSLALAAVAAAWYWLPARNEADALRQRIDAKRKHRVETMYRIELTRAYSAAEREIGSLEMKLDSQAVQLNLVNHLNQLAHKYNVKIQSESYEEGKIQDGYAPLYHELSLLGSYASIRAFLAGIHGLPTFSVIQEAVLSGTRETHGIKAHLRLVTYRRVNGAHPAAS